jgi:glycosyltransferase involved in cell wall biosynthesis
MYTGHLHKGKGVQTLIQAAADIDGSVYVVGGYEDDIRWIQSSVTVPENVQFTGLIKPAAMPAYQVASDILVAPYTSDARDYISPLKLFEYMAAGKPIVTTTKPVLKEVVTHGENALLAEPGDPASLAERVTSLATDPDRQTALGTQARKDVEQYTWERRAARILAFIEGLE